MVKVLELFSGTHSVGKCCQKLGWDVVSVDLELPATHECDVMDFDYKQYPKDDFDIIWASPPCTYYSNLQNCWLGQVKADGILFTKEILEERRIESDKLILKTLEIIDYFKPHWWFMENPQRGTLKNRDVVKDLKFYDVSYCMFSDWGYEKRTRIWTNKEWSGAKVCDKSGACGNMVEIPTNGAVRHDTGKPLQCKSRKLHANNCGKSEQTKSLRHKQVLGNGYELMNGEVVLCNTKEKRDKFRQHKKTCDGGYDKRKKHQLNVANDVHTNLGKGTNKLDRYRVPEDLIFSLFLDD